MIARPFTVALEAVLRRLHARVGTSGGTHVQLTVLTGQNSVLAAFAREEPDTNYGVVVTPSWDTTVSVPAGMRGLTGCLIAFGTVAPADASVDVLVFRSED